MISEEDAKCPLPSIPGGVPTLVLLEVAASGITTPAAAADAFVGFGGAVVVVRGRSGDWGKAEGGQESPKVKASSLEVCLDDGVSPKLILAPSLRPGMTLLATGIQNADLDDTKLLPPPPPPPPALLRCPAGLLLPVVLPTFFICDEDVDFLLDDDHPPRLKPKAAIEGFGSATKRRADSPRSRRRSGGAVVAKGGPGGEDTNIIRFEDSVIVSSLASRYGAWFDDLRRVLI